MINIMINHYLMVTFMMVIFIKRYLLVYMVLKFRAAVNRLVLLQ